VRGGGFAYAPSMLIAPSSPLPLSRVVAPLACTRRAPCFSFFRSIRKDARGECERENGERARGGGGG